MWSKNSNTWASGIFAIFAASDPAAGSGQSGGTHVAHRVLLGSFNIADQGDGGIPDLNRVSLCYDDKCLFLWQVVLPHPAKLMHYRYDQIISAVLGSIGIPNIGSSIEGSDPMVFSENSNFLSDSFVSFSSMDSCC